MIKYEDNQEITITIKSKRNPQLRDCTKGKTYNGRFNTQGSTDLQGMECLKDTISFFDDVGDVVGLHTRSLGCITVTS